MICYISLKWYPMVLKASETDYSCGIRVTVSQSFLLRYMDTPQSFSAMFSKGDVLLNFLFAYWRTKSSQNGVNS